MPTCYYQINRIPHMVRRSVILSIFLLLVCCQMNAQSKDSEQLGMALEYFQGGKYHEAMLLLEKLDRRYNLNPRYKAYLGVCYYYEWEFKKTTECLDSLLPKLEVFAPVICLKNDGKSPMIVLNNLMTITSVIFQTNKGVSIRSST